MGLESFLKILYPGIKLVVGLLSIPETIKPIIEKKLYHVMTLDHVMKWVHGEKWRNVGHLREKHFASPAFLYFLHF